MNGMEELNYLDNVLSTLETLSCGECQRNTPHSIEEHIDGRIEKSCIICGCTEIEVHENEAIE